MKKLPTKDQLKRDALFVPCESKEALHRWIKLYLGIDLPQCLVDPTSTSTIMDVLWEVYDRALRNDVEGFQEFLAYASRDSFKCVEKGTLVLGKHRGLIPIESVKIGDVLWSGKAWRKVTDWVDEGVKDSVSVELQNGVSLTTSPVHRVWAWSPKSVPGWKRVSELTKDDMVCWDVKSDFGNTETDSDEFEIGYLCGILQGDGCLRFMNYKGSKFVTLTTADPYVLDFWKKICVKWVGREPRQSKARQYDWSIRSLDFCKRLQDLGLTASYSWEKDFPQRCMKNISVLAGFISGLYDTDGTIDSKKSLSFSMTCEKLLRKLTVVLAALGVSATFRTNKLYPEHGQKHRVYIVTIPQTEIGKLLSVGVKLSANKVNSVETPLADNCHAGIPRGQLQVLLSKFPTKGSRARRIGKKPALNTYKTTTKEKVKKLIQYGLANDFLSNEEFSYWNNILSNQWVCVKSVSTGRTAHFFDLTVEEDHSYWSNGLISHNTLGVSIFEVLCILHLRRSVAHMAAIETQAQKAQSYVEKFFNRPYLKEYLVSKNKRYLEIVRYFNPKTGKSLPTKEWQALLPEEQGDYTFISDYIAIVICTLQGANSQHTGILVCDELDVVANPDAFEEAKFIPATFNGILPITILTSTRKFSFGLVQKEIDNAEHSGLQIRHWNILDVTQACDPKRHKPDEPHVKLYRSDFHLRTISEADYQLLDAKSREKYVEDDGFAGCANCKIFAVCQKRLATKQLCKSPLLKPIPHIIQQFRKVSVEKAKAQLMCWKPSTEGLVYGRFSRELHVKKPYQIAEMITGFQYPETMDKATLIDLMKERKLRFFSGMDFGYTHNFAVVTIAVDGKIAYVVDVIAISELELAQKIQLCKERILHYDPTIFADVAYPSDIKTFKREGFRMKDWSKKPDSVTGGIEVVRTKLMPAVGQPELFILDEGIKGAGGGEEVTEGGNLLAFHLRTYHWKLDAAGVPSDIPDDEDDDLPDALRYVVMNLFDAKNKPMFSSHVQQEEQERLQQQAAPKANVHEEWMRQTILEQVDGSETPAPSARKRKGSFVFDV